MEVKKSEKKTKVINAESDQYPNTLDKMESVINEFKFRQVLTSRKFILLFFVTMFKTASNFYFAMESKFLGMILIQDDSFLTTATSVLALCNIFIRMFLGPLFDIVGIKGMYFINILLNLCSVFFLFFWGESKIGFTIFFAFNRVSNGKFD